MSTKLSTLESLSDVHKALLIAGAGVLFILAILIYFSLYQEEFATLFEDLGQGDAAKVVEELERQGIEYQLGAGGDAIFVEAGHVDEARLRVAAEGLLPGTGNGFELFDSVGYGASEFAQKVSYQRALQGELARTIEALPEIRAARVHIVLPERSLFSADQAFAKASVILAEEANLKLSPEQVHGIRRLVASAVDGMEISNVAVLDGKGVSLDGAMASEPTEHSANLSFKKQYEDYLLGKAERILTQAFGFGNALANVDVMLDFEEIQTTEERYLPGSTDGNRGVLLTSRTEKQYTDLSSNEQKSDDPNSLLTSESVQNEYKVGRLVEQKITDIGSVKKLSVSVMIPKASTDQQTEAVRSLVAAALGIELERGDQIVVHAILSPQEKKPRAQAPENNENVAQQSVDLLSNQELEVPVAVDQHTLQENKSTVGLAWGLVVLPFVLLLGGLVFYLTQRSKVSRLNEIEREALLEEIEGWLGENDAPIIDAGQSAHAG